MNAIYQSAYTFNIMLLLTFFLYSTNVTAQADSSKVQLLKDTFVESNPILLYWQQDWVDLSGIKETKCVYNRFVKTYNIWVLTHIEGKKATFKNFTILFNKYRLIGHTSGSSFIINGAKYLLINNFDGAWYKKLGSYSFAIKYTDVIDIVPPE